VKYSPPNKLNGTESNPSAKDAEVIARNYLDWQALSSKEPPARDWRIPDWLTTGVTLCAGRGGIGKTTLAQTIASTLAKPTEFLAPIGSPLVNLFWACEDDHDELWRRQVAICKTLSIDMKLLDDLLYIESRFGRDNTLYAPVMGQPMRTPVFKLLREQVNDTGADILWLDNIGHTFGCNENDRHQVTSFVNELVSLRTDKPFSIVLLAHPARSAGSEYAGSAAWENAVRTRWYFGDKLPDQADEDAEPQDDVRYLCRRKANYTFRDYRKFTFRRGVFMPDPVEVELFGDRYGGATRSEDLDSIVLLGLDRCIQAGIHATDGRTSPDYLPARLIAMNLHAGRSKKELAGAMNRLMADGRLKRAQVGIYANRNPKFGLIRP
jgi:RecA-family ATPase